MYRHGRSVCFLWLQQHQIKHYGQKYNFQKQILTDPGKSREPLKIKSHSLRADRPTVCWRVFAGCSWQGEQSEQRTAQQTKQSNNWRNEHGCDTPQELLLFLFPYVFRVPPFNFQETKCFSRTVVVCRLSWLCFRVMYQNVIRKNGENKNEKHDFFFVTKQDGGICHGDSFIIVCRTLRRGRFLCWTNLFLRLVPPLFSCHLQFALMWFSSSVSL